VSGFVLLTTSLKMKRPDQYVGVLMFFMGTKS
jgi:hypothetical protein